ncbi:hypothetical protein M5689_002483 [Euphorbia peplus]|nr:hypothetical protein M5689_002483 [Euphorbia peplus]
MESKENPSPSPYRHPNPSSSSLLKDISNFKTPKKRPSNPNFTSPCPQFFTASKQTPRTSSALRYNTRPSVSAKSKQKTATARRLKAFELEQSQSSRKAEIRKEQSLKSLAKSLTTWLNFLFQNPKSCGCELSGGGDQDAIFMGKLGKLGKRDGGARGGVVSVGDDWRSPKRRRDIGWRGGGDNVGDEGLLGSKEYGVLRDSLMDVCSFDDLKQRMRVYLSWATCKEIFDVMTHVVKNIDDGRLKMKSHCPMVTDFGMKEKAIKILMCYNPVWLRVGMHIIFGGDSLLPNDDVNSDKDIAFLKMVINKQFFSHAGLAKEYAYNKKVEGLYRPGYYENMGTIMLKRFLLLVLLLDRAKSHSALPLKYGIDGVDGGSPLLFTAPSSIKSSCQMVNDFLSSDNMLGEGNLLAHLVIVGYKVSYQQNPLVDYDFKVTDLCEDLQDGVRLCRAIQLLQNDSSILSKIVVPSDTRKKNIVNCGIALQHLKKMGLTLCDEDGVMIMEDDIANGDKELTISFLWKIFVHFQVPLLINKAILADEILKIQGFNVDSSNSFSLSSSSLELLLKWMQVICEKYDHKLDDFSSLVDGKAIWCLLDYYFNKELWCSHSLKDPHESSRESIMSVTEYADAVHNFILSQKLTTLLGNFPEVLQISDILEHSGAINERSVVVLLVFLASQLTAKQNLDQLNFHKLLCSNCQSPEKRQSSSETRGDSSEDSSGSFKAIKAWWQDMAARNNRFVTMPATSTLQQRSNSRSNNIRRENAATCIQSHLRKSIARRKYLKLIDAVQFLQIVIRAWLILKQNSGVQKFNIVMIQKAICSGHDSSLMPFYTSVRRKHSGGLRYTKFIVERHIFLKIKRSVLVIQQAARIWMERRLQARSTGNHDSSAFDLTNAAIVVQKYYRSWIARSWYKATQMERDSQKSLEKSTNLETTASVEIQLSLMNYISSRSLQHVAAIKIQSHMKAWLLRRKFLKLKYFVTKIQNEYRSYISRRSLQHLAATKIQSHMKAWLLRRRFLKFKYLITKIQSDYRCLRCWRSFRKLKISTRSAVTIQSHVRGWIARREARRCRLRIDLLQKCFRSWLIRRDFLLLREAATQIQCAIRSVNCGRVHAANVNAAVEIQRFARGQIARKRLLGASHFHVATNCNFRTSVTCIQSSELKIVISSILKLQSWWRGVLLHKLRTKSATIIQSYIRGWIDQQRASKKRHSVVIIQSHWKGYIARKESKGQLLDLRLRVQRSAKNVDDSMRIINRLKMALSELLTMKSISGILHTCATLDMTTKHSQKCCEELVGAGAISILLKLIRSVSRSIPDQEVLKYALSTIRNLTRHQHLTQVLIDCSGSIETIFLEFHRNKEEGYFIASEILKKICSNQKGAESLRKASGLLKRLRNLVDELTRKVAIEKRNIQGVASREKTERRLREAAELLKLVTTNHF